MASAARHPGSARALLLVAGGGSGGHVFPALAVADELAARGWRLAWVGRRGGMEERLVSRHGMRFYALPAAAVVGRGVLGRAAALATLTMSALRARSMVRRLGADLVLGTGGYVSAPAVLGARLARRPALLLEPNARAGAANRWLSRFARGAVVAYREAEAELRCPVHLTGVPVRREFFGGGPAPESGSRTVLVLGGSQGALELNQLLPEALATLPPSCYPLRVVHQAGEAHAETVRQAYADRTRPELEVEVTPFLADVADAMKRAHLVVSRAGAVTLAEICAAGLPAVLVPLAIAGGHQVDNARAVAAAGGARMLAAGAATAQCLAEVLAELLSSAEQRRRMSATLRGLARPDAAAAIADVAENLAEAA